jgi:tetratricopeptide (TPR) repeat protein
MTRVVWVCVLCIAAGLALSSCRKTPEQRAAAFIAKGKNLLEKRQYASANLEFLNASRLRPGDSEVLHLLATAAIAGGNYAEAIGYLRKAIEKNPQYLPARVKLAEIMASSPVLSHVKEAESAAEAAVHDAPSDSEALRVLAKAQLKLGDYKSAEDQFTKSVSMMPQNLRASIGLAVLKWRKNDLPGAEDILKRAVESAPKAPEPLIVLGRFYRLTKRLPEAGDALRRAAQMNRFRGLALEALAQIYAEQKRDNEVEATYRAMAQLPERRFKPLHAVYLFGRGRQAEAVAELKALADADKSDREARSRLVSAYMLTNQPQAAVKVVTDALNQNGKDVSALLDRGRLYLAAGKAEDLERDMRRVIQLTSNSAEAHYLLAMSLRKSMKRSARQELTEALSIDPQFLAARVELSAELRRANEFQAAQGVIDQAPPSQRRGPELTIEQNWIWLANGQYTSLKKSLDEVQKPAQNPTLLVQAALLQLQRKDYPGAIERAEEALRINPLDLRAIDALATAYVGQKQVAAAVAKVRECADAQPQSAQMRYYLATWLLKTDHQEEARLELKKAIGLDSAFAPARLTMAQSELAAGQYDAARQQVGAILEKNPRNGAALMLSGVIEESAHNFDQAIQAYRKVLDVDDTNPLAMNNLAYLTAEHTQDLGQALKYAEQAKQISPESADVDDTLGWIYFRRGVYANAIRHLEMADKRRPAAVTKYHLAMAYHRTGERDRATQAMAAGLRLNPSLAEAAAAAALLAQ